MPDVPTMRQSVLDEAGSIIAGDRQQTYGNVAESFARTALVWSGILGVTVTATQVAQCMVGIKLTRLSASPTHHDSWVDIAGYAALGREVAQESVIF